ncbi:MAG TPA: 4Fe-4S dicluster domain-containing protein [Anaerolineales bacterium]|nr:4Fe-4S dicluster domain-containing protein [Anaerolineae bacterium]HIQ01047.1 4Fe-4S dicluster domain-containing protein [Anaerolineales bacterium]
MATAFELDLTFGREVQTRSGAPVLRCYFCQKCTAGCPVAYAMDYKPAQVLRLIQLGQRDVVLSSSAIWLCVGCEACGTRCPNQIRLAPMFDTLRYMALEEGYSPDPAVYALHRSFLDSIRLWGRVHELTMLMEYKLRSPFGSDLLADIRVGLTLLLKGKITHLPERVRGLAQVRRLYKEAERRSSTEVET